MADPAAPVIYMIDGPERYDPPEYWARFEQRMLSLPLDNPQVRRALACIDEFKRREATPQGRASRRRQEARRESVSKPLFRAMMIDYPTGLTVDQERARFLELVRGLDPDLRVTFAIRMIRDEFFWLPPEQRRTPRMREVLNILCTGTWTTEPQVSAAT